MWSTIGKVGITISIWAACKLCEDVFLASGLNANVQPLCLRIACNPRNCCGKRTTLHTNYKQAGVYLSCQWKVTLVIYKWPIQEYDLNKNAQLFDILLYKLMNVIPDSIKFTARNQSMTLQ